MHRTGFVAERNAQHVDFLDRMIYHIKFAEARKLRLTVQVGGGGK